MKQNGWVFISHSHKDIERVRKIRNKLEELGFEPLLFFLKCLSDEDEIEELIKREIDEREWFIYVDSANARRSHWVQTEREYIETRGDKKIFTLDLSRTIEEQMKEIERIARQMKVFIAASAQDKPLVNALSKALAEHDMQVLTDEEVEAGTSWLNAVRHEIDVASRNGFVLIVISEHMRDAAYALRETEMAIASGGKILPLYVGKAHMPPSLLEKLGTVSGVHISETPTEEEISRVITAIENSIRYYESDMTVSHGFRAARHIILPPLSRIEADTFALCENLEAVTVPESVIYIDAKAFEGLGDILIRCYPDSYAERFCKIHQIRYETTGD